LATATAAAADTKRACIAANEEAQAVRDERKLVKAREIFLQCAVEACPGVVRQDCQESVEALDDQIPTVVVQATDPSGAPLTAVKVSIDGEVAQESLDGEPLRLDPGVHWFRFESTGHGARELRVVAVEGEQKRKIVMRFTPETARSNAAGSASRRGSASPSAGGAAEASGDGGALPSDSGADDSVTAYVVGGVLGGVGLVAIGVGVGMYYSGLSQRSDGIDNGCGDAAQCDEEKDSIKTKLIVGDVLAGVGVGAIVGGIIAIVIGTTGEPSDQETSRRAWQLASPVPVIEVHPTRGGTMATAAWSF
jgi:hypothetical protein